MEWITALLIEMNEHQQNLVDSARPAIRRSGDPAIRRSGDPAISRR